MRRARNRSVPGGALTEAPSEKLKGTAVSEEIFYKQPVCGETSQEKETFPLAPSSSPVDLPARAGRQTRSQGGRVNSVKVSHPRATMAAVYGDSCQTV
ncbi:hypothetical protein SKAU_G00365510 [Synaphobranchus kaupii]|uniref:Uncharacterized protein n=1 Tax=Synaphobranchus kaupii TaxID=118154 RepID=A0A9Q1EEZ9_SYNKA|nr:hypothetical protein SKAU_G00365510 [Synaphobranchus kaupii]